MHKLSDSSLEVKLSHSAGRQEPHSSRKGKPVCDEMLDPFMSLMGTGNRFFLYTHYEPILRAPRHDHIEAKERNLKAYTS